VDFPASGFAHDRDGLARLDLEGDVVDDFGGGIIVFETDVVEDDVAFDRRGEAIPGVLERFIEDQADSVARSDVLAHIAQRSGDVAERPDHHVDEQEGQDQGAWRNLVRSGHAEENPPQKGRQFAAEDENVARRKEEGGQSCAKR
jgi:hypothetical protein